MRKNIIKILFSSIIIFTLLTSCNKTNDGGKISSTPGTEATVNTSDNSNLIQYSPFKENVAHVYKLTSEGEGIMVTFPDFIDKENNLYQLRTVTQFSVPGNSADQNTMYNNSIIEVYKFNENNLEIINSYNDFFNFTNMTKEKPYDDGKHIITAMEKPLKKGTSWTVGKHREDNNIIATVTNESVDVTVPYGTFKAVEITQVYENNTPTESNPRVIDKIIKYYVKDIGLIKSEQYNVDINSDKPQIFTWELSSIEENYSYTNKYRFYYPIKIDDAYVTKFEEKQKSFTTNEDDIAFFQDSFRSYSTEGVNGIMSDNVKINSIKYNPDEYTATIDLSKEFVDEMIDDVDYENSVLQSIVNTLGVYYYIPDVIINIDGEAYKSKNIQMEKDEIIKIYIEEEAPVEE